MTLRLTADSLPRLLSISNSTFCPSFSVLRPARSTAEIWTNTSLPPPPEGWINPYPFVGLNHFTLPVAISISHANQQNTRRARARQAPRSRQTAAYQTFMPRPPSPLPRHPAASSPSAAEKLRGRT